MNKKNEMIKQEICEVDAIEEQQLYEDIRMILQQAREQTYSNASEIMTYAYWNVGRRIVEQEQAGEKKPDMVLI